MDYSAKLTLPYILPNQAQKHVTMNESLRRLDALVQISVISMTETTPPAAPEEGDRYIVAAGGTGAWDRADGQMVAYQDGAWEVYQPQTGWLVWDESDNATVVFDGVGWKKIWTESPVMLGVNAVADPTHRLSINAHGSLFSHDGAGHQISINRSDESEQASILFKSSWQGNAELGLSGSPDFSIKVSENGADFAPVFLARQDGKNVGIGTWSPSAQLHVGGTLKIGMFTINELPDPAVSGKGAIVFVDRAADAPTLALSDGQKWTLLS